MAQYLKCKCGARLRLPEGTSVNSGKCPKCQTRFELRSGAWKYVREGKTTKPVDRAVELEKPPPPDQRHTPTASQQTSVSSAGRMDDSPPIGHPSAQQSATHAPPLIATPISDAEVVSGKTALHKDVRAILVDILQHQTAYPKRVALAIALAAHPWPDEEVAASTLEAITAEMLPARNLRHHDSRELAIDRLLRIAEALQHEGEARLAATFFDAADQVLGASLVTEGADRKTVSDNCRIASLRDVACNPLGIGIPRSASTTVGATDAESEGATNAEQDTATRQMIAQLLGAAAASDSHDVGIVCGGNETGVTVEQLAHRLNVALPLDALDAHIDALDSRDRDILISRTFTLDKPKVLSEVAQHWGITRERVRQRETRIRDNITSRFADTIAGIGRPSLREYSTKIVRTEALHALARELMAASKWRDTAAAMVLDLLGPWSDWIGWAIHPSIESRVQGLRRFFDDAADDYGILSPQSVDESTGNLFTNDTDREQFLTDAIGLGRPHGFWTVKNTLRCQVVATLRFIGRPASKEEVAELLQHPPASVSSILGSIDGIVRADRHRWGFSELIEDPYDGIVGEIKQRIEDYGGAVPIDLILKEVPERFGVSESSVKAYLASDAFKVEDDIVRDAAPHEFSPQPPASCPGAVQVNGLWGQRLRLHARHFVGYSLGVSFDVAFANGMRPGDDLLVPVADEDYQASLIWRPHSLNRLVDVGRLSDLLTRLDFKENDEIVVVPSCETVELLRGESVSREVASVDETTSQNHDGAIEEVRDPLLDLLGDS